MQNLCNTGAGVSCLLSLLQSDKSKLSNHHLHTLQLGLKRDNSGCFFLPKKLFYSNLNKNLIWIHILQLSLKRDNPAVFFWPRNSNLCRFRCDRRLPNHWYSNFKLKRSTDIRGRREILIFASIRWLCRSLLKVSQISTSDKFEYW